MSEIYRSSTGARLLRERYRRTLDGWPIDNKQSHVPTPEGETFVVACGPEAGPPLVLLHGSGGNSAQWLDRIAELATQFRVYAVDMIGEQGLSAPSRPPLESDRHAKWLDAVLDSLGLDRVPLMGISLGGWVALDYALRRPGRVERLALTCPGGIGRQQKGSLVKALLLNPLGRWGKRKSVAALLGPAVSAMGPAEQETVLDEVELVSKNYRYRMDTLPIFDDDMLARLTIPVHVFAGELDAMFDSTETKRRLEAAAPHARVRLLPDTGHYVPAQPGVELEFLTSAEPEQPHA